MISPKFQAFTSLSFFIFFFFSTIAFAQSDKDLLADLVIEEQEAVNALIMYPPEVRLAILKSTKHPTALIKMESLQSQTKNSFNALMEDLSFKDQQMIWDLTRYPNLISAMVNIGKGNPDDLKQELLRFDEVIHPRARIAYQDHYFLLKEIDQLSNSVESAFATLISQYPIDIQEALRSLKDLPEVLSLLIQNIRLTVMVGEVYANDPEWLIQKTDSLHLVVARQNAEEVEAWKTSLNENEVAKEELKASTEEYETASGYDDEYYDYDQDYSQDREVIVRNHYYYHYPYWFGYPSWYMTPRWRCYPIYYDWGFYVPHGVNVVIIGLPSYHFTNWYFYNFRHHHHWPHLSSHFVHHYHNYYYSSSSITTSVTEWRSINRQVVSREWLKDDANLPERFKDFGKFEASRENYNRTHPGREVSQKEFANKQTKTYPNLAKNAQEYQKQVDTKRKQKVSPQISKPKAKQPVKVRPQKIPPKATPKKSTPRKTVPKKTTPKKKESGKNIPQVKKGTDYHRQSLEKNKRVKTNPVSPRKKQGATPTKTKRTKKKTSGTRGN